MLSLRGRLFLSSILLIALSAGAGLAILAPRIASDLTEKIRADLFHRALLITDEAVRLESRGAGLDAWDWAADEYGRLAGARVTFIALDGRVLGDSEVPADSLPRIENHADRPEVRAALASGKGSSIRRSATLRRMMLYVAVPWRKAEEGGGVVRVAVPFEQVERVVRAFRRLVLLGSLFGVAAAALVSTLAARWISRPVEELARIASRIESRDAVPLASLAAGTAPATGLQAARHHRDEVRRVARTLDGLVEDLARVSETLRRERDLLSAILEGMAEGILLVDASGTILLANAALRESLGNADPVGKTTLEALRSLPLEGTIAAARSSPDGAGCEISIGGLAPRALAVRAARVSPAPESPLLVSFHDVTESRRLDATRRDFVANASHELRTPVAAIRGAAEILEGEALGLSADARSYAEIVRRRASQLSQLIDDLLDLSRIETGALTLVSEKLDLRHGLATAAAAFEAPARARGISIAIEVPDDLPRVVADSRAFHQVARNLLDNAVKYTSEGTVITLRAEVWERFVAVTVADAGPGIEARHLDRLFERFYRVDVSRSRALGGTGLGLAIVKHLVEAMGGQAGVESTLGAGTVFRFTLPSV